MSEIVTKSLHEIIKGTAIVITGTMASMLLAFIARVMIIRITTQSEYGVYTLALSVVGIFATISTMGLSEGVTRHIAYFRGNGNLKNVKATIFSSIKIALISSVLFTIISLYYSDFISVNIFQSPELANVLKIFVFTIPFIVFINLFIAIFRGFGNVNTHVYFNNLLKPVLNILLLIVVILLGLSFLGVVYAYFLSILITCTLFTIYIWKRYALTIGKNELFNNSMTKDLLFFSIPLLAVGVLIQTMSWTDTLMLGYFKTPKEVGIYNAALPLAHLLSIVVTSVAFLYTPIMSKLYGEHKMEELRLSYAISTKWIFIGTLPIFFILFMFPTVALNSMFGPRYVGASDALQILALGFIFNSYFGLNYYTLITIGKSKFIMQCTLISAVINVILNIILIPEFSLVGAAIASALSFAVVEPLMALKLYKTSRAHPFTKTYLKTTVISILVISFFYCIKNLFDPTIGMLAILFPLFLLVYVLALTFTKSFDTDDIIMLSAIGKKLGISAFITKFQR